MHPSVSPFLILLLTMVIVGACVQPLPPLNGGTEPPDQPPPPAPPRDYLAACDEPFTGRSFAASTEELQAGSMILAAPVGGLDREYDGYLIELSETLLGASRFDLIIDADYAIALFEEALRRLDIPDHIIVRIDEALSDVPRGRFVIHIDESYLEALSEHPYIERIYPNYRVRTQLCDSLERIGAPAFLSASSSYGRGTTIAVLDTGVDYTHPALGGCIGPGCKVIGGYDFISDDDDPMDLNGHGTHVASIAAGGEPLGGVAPEANILAVRVLDERGEGTIESVINGLDYVLEQHETNPVDVVVMSLGAELPAQNPLNEKVDELTSRGILVVAAAGNSGPILHSVAAPGNAKSALTVGATNNRGAIMSFSSRGPVRATDGSLYAKPDVVAPGHEICASRSSSFALDGTECFEGYVSQSGTSMAAPHVAGLAAVLKADDPTRTSEQIQHHIRTTALRDQLGSYNTIELIGHGSIRADVALSTWDLPSIELDVNREGHVIELSGTAPPDTTIVFREVSSGRSGPTRTVSGSFEYTVDARSIDDGTYSIIASAPVDTDDARIETTALAYAEIENFELTTDPAGGYVGTSRGPRFEVDTSLDVNEAQIQTRTVFRRSPEDGPEPWSEYCTIHTGSCTGPILAQGQYEARVSAQTPHGTVHSVPVPFNVVEGLAEGTVMHIPQSFGGFAKVVPQDTRTLHTLTIKEDPSCTGWCRTINHILETGPGHTEFVPSIGTAAARRIIALISGPDERGLALENLYPSTTRNRAFEFTERAALGPIATDLDYREIARVGTTYYATNSILSAAQDRKLVMIEDGVQRAVSVPSLRSAFSGLDTDDRFMIRPVTTDEGVRLIVIRSAYLASSPDRSVLAADVFDEAGSRIARTVIADTRQDPAFVMMTNPVTSDAREAVYLIYTRDMQSYSAVWIGSDGSVQREPTEAAPYGISLDDGTPLILRSEDLHSTFSIRSDDIDIRYITPSFLTIDGAPSLYDFTGDGKNEIVLFLRSRYADGHASRIVVLNRDGTTLFERYIGVLRGGLQLDFLAFTDHNNDGSLELLLGLNDVSFTRYPGVGASMFFVPDPATLRMVIETDYPYDSNRIGWQTPYGDTQGRYAGGP